MTHRCNVRCDGCYYYEGDKQNALDNVHAAAWRDLFRAEKARGITFVVLVLQGEYKVKFDEDNYPSLTTVRAIAEQIRQLQGTVS